MKNPVLDFVQNNFENQLGLQISPLVMKDNDWVIVDGDRNVVDNQHDGEDVGGGDEGDGGEGGGGGDGFHALISNYALLDPAFELKNASIQSLMQLRERL